MRGRYNRATSRLGGAMPRRWVIPTLLGLLLALVPGQMPPSAGAQGDITYVAGSTQKICQLTGEMDRQLGVPTASQTETRAGLVGADNGFSFEHDGKLFFLFGDSKTTPTFNGQPNRDNAPPRTTDDNDSIAYTTDTSLDPCLHLTFIANPNGAFKNPVVLNDQGRPAITLRVDEVPVAGVSANGRMYVLFGTDNYVYPSPGPSVGDLGSSTRGVMGASDDDGNTFHYLYDLSAGPGAKFVYGAIASGDSGYLYFWGIPGGMARRHSPVYFARKQAAAMDQPGGMEYFTGVGPDGQPTFSAAEADAAPLFIDTQGANAEPRPCMFDAGVQWNPFVQRWIMLYNCADSAPGVPSGIRMRVA